MNDHTNHIDASSSTHPLTPAPAHPLITPQARQPINIRPAVPGDRDFAFVDALQKQHSKMLGFMHRQTLENYIEAGDLLIAETPPPRAPDGRELPEVHGLPLGYCMGRDTYFKREDVGIIYQLVVGETQRRSLDRRDARAGDVREGGVRLPVVLAAGARRIWMRTISGSRSGSCRWRSGRDHQRGEGSASTSSGRSGSVKAMTGRARRRTGSRRIHPAGRSVRIGW
jgi:hypothetical protein